MTNMSNLIILWLKYIHFSHIYIKNEVVLNLKEVIIVGLNFKVKLVLERKAKLKIP